MVAVTDAVQQDPQLLEYFKEQVAASCRIIAQHGLVKGSTGHVSRRVPGTNDILIRGRPHADKGLRFAEPASIIRVGEDARPVGDTHGVSRVGEIYLHTEVYKRRPEVNAVIHAHPPGALLCTINGVELRPIFGGYYPPAMRMAAEGVPTYDRSITLHTLEETTPMLEVMGNSDAILLSRHGTLVTGKSVEEATSRAIMFETLCRLNWLARLQGDPGEISDIDKEEWLRRARVAAKSGGRGEDREDRSWSHYMALLETGTLYYDDIGLGFRF